MPLKAAAHKFSQEALEFLRGKGAHAVLGRQAFSNRGANRISGVGPFRQLRRHIGRQCRVPSVLHMPYSQGAVGRKKQRGVAPGALHGLLHQVRTPLPPHMRVKGGAEPTATRCGNARTAGRHQARGAACGWPNEAGKCSLGQNSVLMMVTFLRMVTFQDSLPDWWNSCHASMPRAFAVCNLIHSLLWMNRQRGPGAHQPKKGTDRTPFLVVTSLAVATQPMCMPRHQQAWLWYACTMQPFAQ